MTYKTIPSFAKFSLFVNNACIGAFVDADIGVAHASLNKIKNL